MIHAKCFHEDVFYEYFRPFQHPDAQFDIWGGYGLETFGNDLQLVRAYPEEFVWTVLHGGNGPDQWIVPGFYYVNRVCYLLTEVSHGSLSVEFRAARSNKSLTPRGLTRRISALRKLFADGHHGPNLTVGSRN